MNIKKLFIVLFSMAILITTVQAAQKRQQDDDSQEDNNQKAKYHRADLNPTPANKAKIGRLNAFLETITESANDDINTVKELLAEGVNAEGEAPIHRYFSEIGARNLLSLPDDIVLRLLDPATINQRDANGQTPLMMLAHDIREESDLDLRPDRNDIVRESFAIIDLLRAAGADFTITNDDDLTAYDIVQQNEELHGTVPYEIKDALNPDPESGESESGDGALE